MKDLPPTRPVYLLGESFGGLLAAAVAAERPDLVDRIVLVNPATSFPRSVWPTLGPLLPSVPTVRPEPAAVLSVQGKAATQHAVYWKQCCMATSSAAWTPAQGAQQGERTGASSRVVGPALPGVC